MSTTATDHIFNTHELVHLVAAHLHKADLSRFLQTNRLALHNLLLANALVSPDSIQALARNALSVQFLSIGLAEVTHLYNCFRAFEQQEDDMKQGLAIPSQSPTVTTATASR
ncbi:MAG: hypothetical protein J3R72DRAFT_484950 [Linnemannia gamsii]|nr:MAG: hypothetical protein J3R72DRAFT_484950 [Linnemannia gamsii]